MPKKLASIGKYSKSFFNKKGELKNINKLNFWPLEDVLGEKYGFAPEVAAEVASFVIPLLDFNPKKRMTAAEALQNPFLAEKLPPPVRAEAVVAGGGVKLAGGAGEKVLS
jgi:serine/threonine-protein kinase SRPK3